MKETIKLLDRSPANILIFNAMAAMIPDDSDMLKHFDLEANGDASTATVEVFVNGIAVPFKDAFVAALKGLFDSYEENLKEAALELIKENTTLSNLQYEIETAEWKIRDALDKLMEEG